MFWTKYSSMLFLKSSDMKVSATRSLISSSWIMAGRTRGTCGRTPGNNFTFLTSISFLIGWVDFPNQELERKKACFFSGSQFGKRKISG